MKVKLLGDLQPREPRTVDTDCSDPDSSGNNFPEPSEALSNAHRGRCHTHAKDDDGQWPEI